MGTWNVTLVTLHLRPLKSPGIVVVPIAERTLTGSIIYRAVLIGGFLVITTPVSALVIARAAYLRGEKMETPDAVDESGRGLSEKLG